MAAGATVVIPIPKIYDYPHHMHGCSYYYNLKRAYGVHQVASTLCAMPRRALTETSG